MAAHDVNRMDYPRETEQKGVDDVDEEFQTASYYFWSRDWVSTIPYGERK